jgi:hypothetical protein
VVERLPVLAEDQLAELLDLLAPEDAPRRRVAAHPREEGIHETRLPGQLGHDARERHEVAGLIGAVAGPSGKGRCRRREDASHREHGKASRDLALPPFLSHPALVTAEPRTRPA